MLALSSQPSLPRTLSTTALSLWSDSGSKFWKELETARISSRLWKTVRWCNIDIFIVFSITFNSQVPFLDSTSSEFIVSCLPKRSSYLSSNNVWLNFFKRKKTIAFRLQRLAVVGEERNCCFRPLQQPFTYLLSHRGDWWPIGTSKWSFANICHLATCF